MKTSREAKRIARGLFALAKPKGQLDRARINTIADTLVAEQPRAYLQILNEFTRLVRLEVESRHAKISSAVPLDSATTAELEKQLRSQFGSDITTEFQTQPELLGGMRVHFGSDVWDGTVRARLETLRDAI